MSTQRPITDAGGDIAALVYSSSDRPDLILCSFARHLAGSGRRICGLIQFRDRPFAEDRRKFMILNEWRIAEVTRNSDGESRCHIDGDWVNRMAGHVEKSVRCGVDAVIVNRFGPLEEDGGGFCETIKVASATETPLVIAVPEFAFERWTRFSSGMSVRLGCAFEPVLEWWNRVSARSPSLYELNLRACELFK